MYKQENISHDIQNLHWWKTGVIYQIYPKSFQASEAQSTGNILGIIKRLDYLKLLGVSAIWLTPIYPSPQIDNGYDIADYYNINPDYGTMDDFELLVKEAHQKGIRVMMDMVLNHTSTEHHWFKSSLDKDSPYRSFYIWRDGKEDGSEPNNWLSKFGGSAWAWHDESKQYYLHLFAKEQADLNWENPNVRQELKNICQFWANKGIDALRLDVINLVSKDLSFPDDSLGDGRRFYSDGPRIHSFLQEMSNDVFRPNGLATVGEMSSTSLEHCQQYSNLSGTELSMTFNFHHLKVDYPNGDKWALAEMDFIELKRLFKYWQNGMYGKAWNALFWCNHDQPRIVSRFGDDIKYHCASAKMLAMVLYGLQGTPYIYQGEEIGMTNPYFTTISQYRDIESLNLYQEKLQNGVAEKDILAILASKSRDNSRTPMQWNSSINAGFTKGKPWIDVAQNFTKINVESSLQDTNSIFYCYQQLIALRKEHLVFTMGSYIDFIPESKSLWCYLRKWENTYLLVVANFSRNNILCQLPNQLAELDWKILYSNYKNDGESINKSLNLKPYESYYLFFDDNKD